MRDDVNISSRLFLRLILVVIICMFAVLGISVLCNGLGTKEIGYTAYGVKENDNNAKKLYTYYTEQGKDTQKEKYEAEGYVIRNVSIRTEISKNVQTVFYVITSIIGIFALFAFYYNYMWKIGAEDANSVKFQHKKFNKMRGLRIGLFTNLPNILLFVIVAVFGQNLLKNFNMFYYKLGSSYFYSFLDLTIGSGKVVAGDISIWQYLVLALFLTVIPLLCGVSYLMGYKNIMVGNKLIYKKGDR